MTIKTATYLHLLGTALLATGCITYVEFTEEKARLQCEIDVACGGEPRDCEQEAQGIEKGDCTRYHRAKADRCLEALEEDLLRVEQDPNACEEVRSAPQACRDATTSRELDRCEDSGRPLRHEGQRVLAAVTRGSTWPTAEESIETELAAMEPVLRQHAAARWLEIARSEHASVAAFARVSLELMAVGAPPQLVDGCHRAALDEIGHARRALALARALGGEAWDLGALPVVPTRAASLETIAIDALLEGCLGEGAAAACAHVTAARAQGPAAILVRVIAEEETRHAALAWSTLQWALQQDPSLAGPVARAFEVAVAERRARAHRLPREGIGGCSDQRREAFLAAQGLLDDAEAIRIELDVAERVVTPVLARLLAPARASARAAAVT